MATEFEQALDQLKRIETICSLPMLPYTMPQDPLGAAGIDSRIWVGLGVVGVWAAIDAFRERQLPVQGVRPRLASKPDLGLVWDELVDLRHLYAHNFGGDADSRYFSSYPRTCLNEGQPSTLSSGAQFNGKQMLLGMDDLAYYIGQARAIVEFLNQP